MWATTVRDTVLHHAQIAYILCALAFTLAFGVWHYRSRATVPPENRRVAAFVAICAQLFAYNLFKLFTTKPPEPYVWGCVFALLLVLSVGMVWPLPRDCASTSYEEEYQEMV